MLNHDQVTGSYVTRDTGKQCAASAETACSNPLAKADTFLVSSVNGHYQAFVLPKLLAMFHSECIPVACGNLVIRLYVSVATCDDVFSAYLSYSSNGDLCAIASKAQFVVRVSFRLC
jgi:hypothetical protein